MLDAAAPHLTVNGVDFRALPVCQVLQHRGAMRCCGRHQRRIKYFAVFVHVLPRQGNTFGHGNGKGFGMHLVHERPSIRVRRQRAVRHTEERPHWVECSVVEHLGPEFRNDRGARLGGHARTVEQRGPLSRTFRGRGIGVRPSADPNRLRTHRHVHHPGCPDASAEDHPTSENALGAHAIGEHFQIAQTILQGNDDTCSCKPASHVRSDAGGIVTLHRDEDRREVPHPTFRCRGHFQSRATVLAPNPANPKSAFPNGFHVARPPEQHHLVAGVGQKTAEHGSDRTGTCHENACHGFMHTKPGHRDIRRNCKKVWLCGRSRFAGMAAAAPARADVRQHPLVARSAAHYTPAPMRKRPKRKAPTAAATARVAVCAATVFCFALALRWAYLQSIAASPGARFLQTNAARYHAWAEGIVNGAPPVPPFDQPPAYAYTVAILYGLFGSEPHMVRCVHAVIDALQCALLALLAGGCGGIAHAWAVGLLAAAYGPFLYFTGELVPATLPLAFLVAAALASQYHRWRLAATLWALVTVFRAELLLGALLHAAVLAWKGARTPAKVLLFTVLATWLGVTVAVSVAAGRPVPYTTGLGLNLWLGNNPHADGTDPFPPRPTHAALGRAIELHGGDPIGVDRWFLHQVFEFWSSHPRAAAWLLWKKFRWTFVDRELPNTTDIDWQRSYSWLFRLPGFPLSWGPILCLAAATLPLPRRWSLGGPGGSALLAAGIASILVCILFFTHARMRVPAAPLLLLLAGQGVANCLGTLSRQHVRPRLLVAVGFVVLAASLAFTNPHAVRTYRIPALDTNAGVAERLAGHPEKAVDFLSRALAADREDDVAWVHLALAREQLGDLAKAAEAYLDGLSSVPDSVDLARACAAFVHRHNLIFASRSLCSAQTADSREHVRRQLRSWFRLPQQFPETNPSAR